MSVNYELFNIKKTIQNKAIMKSKEILNVKRIMMIIGLVIKPHYLFIRN